MKKVGAIFLLLVSGPLEIIFYSQRSNTLLGVNMSAPPFYSLAFEMTILISRQNQYQVQLHFPAYTSVTTVSNALGRWS